MHLIVRYMVAAVFDAEPAFPHARDIAEEVDFLAAQIGDEDKTAIRLDLDHRPFAVWDAALAEHDLGAIAKCAVYRRERDPLTLGNPRPPGAVLDISCHVTAVRARRHDGAPF